MKKHLLCVTRSYLLLLSLITLPTRLIDASTWGDLQRSSSENVFLEETKPKLKKETFVLSNEYQINLAGIHTKDQQVNNAKTQQTNPTQFYSLGSWLFIILLDIPRSMSTGQPCP